MAAALTGSSELGEFLEQVPLGPDGKPIGGVPGTVRELLEAILLRDSAWARSAILRCIERGVLPDLRDKHIVRGSQTQETYVRTVQYGQYLEAIQAFVDGEAETRSDYDEFCIRTVFKDIADRRRAYGLETKLPDSALIHFVHIDEGGTPETSVNNALGNRVEVRSLTPIAQLAILYHESVHMMSHAEYVVEHDAAGDPFLTHTHMGFVSQTREERVRQAEAFSSGAHPVVEAVTEEAAKRFMQRMTHSAKGNLRNALRLLSDWRIAASEADFDGDPDEVEDLCCAPDGTCSTILYGYPDERRALVCLLNDLSRTPEGLVDTARADELFAMLEAGLYTGEVEEFIRLFDERYSAGAWDSFLRCRNGIEQGHWLARLDVPGADKA